ncbi:MarR family winged helix-turn-helix transcriptional regulator [Martelella soudanensis]|uniref:MarR family winged helix-turn-helix transcriptional regulator n=1 Tax=unclassified Martelella TaxID=2629616 RepID=UPI0015DF8BCC|nr:MULTISPECIES: MarR family transcriptional regulator [unclassified Martelella]
MNLSLNDLSERVRKLELLNENLGYRISRLSKLVEVEAVMRLQSVGVSLYEFRIIIILGIFEEATARDLSELMVIDKGQISRVVSQLVRRGYIRSRQDAENRLFKLLSLTPEGMKVHGKLEVLFEDRNRAFVANVSQDDMETFQRVLAQLSETVEQRLKTERAR